MLQSPLPSLIGGFDPAAQSGLLRVEDDMEHIQPSSVQRGGDFLKVGLDQDGLRGDQVLTCVPGQLGSGGSYQ
jgi:hypothetical protein